MKTGKLKLYDINIPRESIVEERGAIYLSHTPDQRFDDRYSLIG